MARPADDAPTCEQSSAESTEERTTIDYKHLHMTYCFTHIHPFCITST